MEGRSHSELLQAFANAADGRLRIARRVKNKEKKRFRRFYLLGIFLYFYNLCNPPDQ
jgi:hypothetical protein